MHSMKQSLKSTPHRSTQRKDCKSFYRGFTLIELLVVIAIIALLVSILLPSLNKARELAKRATCAANYHSIGLLLTMYLSDTGAFPKGDSPDPRAIYNWIPGVYYGLGGLRDYVEDGSLVDVLNDGDLYTKRGIFSCTDPTAGADKVDSAASCHGNFASVVYIGFFQLNERASDYATKVVSPINPDDLETDAALLTDWWNGNPWDAGYPLIGSGAHGLAGTNVLYIDGSTSWLNSDTIYENASTEWPAQPIVRSAFNR